MRAQKRIFANTLVIAACCGFVSSALAQVPAVQGWSGGTTFSTYDNNGDTVGWYFRPSQNIVITSLGFWDATPADPLLRTHDVAVWNATTQALLGQATVQTNSPLTGEFRYVSVANIALTAGTEYVIGAYYPVGNPVAEGYRGGVTSVQVASDITITNNARDQVVGGSPTLVFPDVRGAATGRFGPNFLYIPEPTTLAMLGLLSFALPRRRG